MPRPQILLIAASIVLANVAYAAPSAKVEAANPFYTASTLPFQMPAFDKIKDRHYAPAYALGMKRQLTEVATIANNPKAATFENTIVAMERSGQLLARVAATFSNLSGANTNDTIESIERELSPKLAAHSDRIMLNAKLYQRVKALYDKRADLGLDAEAKRLLERYHTDFVRAGAKLTPADKEKLKAYNTELAALATAFSQNLL